MLTESPFEVSTPSVRPSEWLAYWRDTTLRRVEPGRIFEHQDFQASLRRLSGSSGEMWDHRGSAIWVRRDKERCSSVRISPIPST